MGFNKNETVRPYLALKKVYASLEGGIRPLKENIWTFKGSMGPLKGSIRPLKGLYGL